MAAFAVGLGVLGLGAAWLLHGPRHAGRADALPATFLAASRSAIIDRAYTFAWRQGLVRIASLVGWVDRYVVDGVMNAVGRAAMLTGSGLRRVQTGLVQDYVVALFLGLLALVAWGVWGR
jgi:NADH:ubiquinone oxidoreductase subunit 5 (subunit L)/multisubunit Na+/H+ antiporter MnhA subunit